MVPSWLRQLFKKNFAGQGKVAPVRHRLSLESLEDRSVPATIRWTGGAVADRDLNGNGHTNDPKTDMGESGSLLWSSPGNWDLGRVPQFGDDVVFPNITPPTSANYIAAYTTQRNLRTPHAVMDLNVTINSLTILGPGPTTGNNPGWLITDLTIKEPLTVFPDANGNLPPLIPDTPTNPATLTILGAVTFIGTGTGELDFQMKFTGNAQNVTVTDPGATLIIGNKGVNSTAFTVNGDISNNPAATGAVGILKLGPGTLQLGGNNSFDGLVEIAQGTLVANNNNALGGTGVGTVVRDGATLTVATGNVRESLQIEGVGTGGGALNGAGQISGGVTMNPSATIGGSLTISGVVSGAGDLTSIGFLTLTNANTYLGATFINANILTITNDDALSPGSYTAVASGASLQLSSSLTSGIRVVDDEMLFLNGQGFDPPDPVAPPVNPPIGALFSTGSVATRATPAMWLSRIFLENDASIGVDLLSTLLVSGQLSDMPISAAALASLSPAELDAFQSYSAQNRPTTPSASLTKRGRGTAIFPNANLDFSGDTFVRNGTLVMQGPQVLGPATSPGVGGSITVQFLINDPVTGLATLEFGTLEVQGQYAVAKNLTLTGNGFNSLGALDITDNPNDGAPTSIEWSAPIMLVNEGATTAATISTEPTTTLNISGVIGGAASTGLQKNGTGLLLLTNSNTFLGALTLRDGVTIINNSGALGGPGGLGTTVSSGAVLALTDGLVIVGEQLTLSSQLGNSAALQVGGGTNVWTGNVNVAGNNQIGSGDEVIINTTNPTGSLEFTGVVSGDAKIRKTGPGTMIFSGSASNTFIDTLQVENGTVVLAKTPTANGAVTNAVAGPIVIGNGQPSTPATNDTAVLRQAGPNQIPDSQPVTVGSIGLWDLNGFTEATGQVSLQGGEITTGATGALILTTGPVTLGDPDLSIITGNVFLGNATRSFNFLPGPSTTFSVNRNPAQAGTSITFTYTLSGGVGAPTPTGKVLFFDRTTNTVLNPQNGGASVLGGTATFVTSTLGVGSHVIEGRYSGDTNYSPQTVVLNEPVLVVNPFERPTLTTSADPAPVGQFVTFTFTLPFNVGEPRPTGNVQFFDGNNLIGTNPLSSGGVAVININTLAVGSHTIRAVYPGDGTYSPIEVDLPNMFVGQPAVLDMSSSANPVLPGAPVTFTFKASGFTGDPTPTGTVQFFDTFNNVTTPLSAPLSLLNDGTQTFTTSTLGVGTHTITARYSGDGVLYLPGIATLAPAQVVGVQPLLRISSSNDPSVNGATTNNNVIFTVNANGDTGQPIPTGTVTFFADGANIGTGTLDATGQTSVPTTGLAVGGHTITARYNGTTGNGDPFYNVGTVTLGYTQPVPQQVVSNPNSTTNATLILSSGNNTSEEGESVTFTLTIFPTTGGALPTGTVRFFDTFTINGQTQTLQIGSDQTVVGANGVGTAAVPTASLRVGTHQISATYFGGNYGAGTVIMNPNQVVVNPVFAYLTVNHNPAAPGGSVDITFNSTLFPGAPAFTGTVRFFDGGIGGQQIGNQTLDANGSAQVTATNLGPGTHTITAQYIPPGSAPGFNPDYAGFFVNLAPNLVVGSPPALFLSSSENPAVTTDVISYTFSALGDPAAPLPTGTVTFFDNGAPFSGGALTLTAGSATAVTNSLTPGPHTITATYSGDSNYAGGTVTLNPNQVVRGTPAQQLTSDANPVASGSNVTFTYIINRASTQDPLPTGTVKFFDTFNGTTIQINATQNLTQNANGATAQVTTNGLTQLGTHVITAVYSGDATYQASTLTFPNEVVSTPPVPPLSPPPTMVTAFTPNLFVNAVISGGPGAGVTKIGGGQMILNGANAYTGPTTINGTNGAIVLATDNVLPDTPLVITNGTLNLNGRSDGVSSLSGGPAGTLNLNGGSLVVGFDNTTQTFAGTITGASGSLTKVGGGALFLTGNSAGLGGVIFAGAPGFPGGVLGGTGTVGPVVVNPGSILLPGAAGANGRLTASNVGFTDGSTFFVRINGTTAATTYDQLKATGVVGISNATLNLSLGYAAALGDQYKIIDAAGGVSGQFRDLSGNLIPNMGGLIVNNLRFQVDYTATGVVLTFMGKAAFGTLSSSVNPSLPGQGVVLTAAYTSPVGTPAGTVDFLDGGTLLQTVPLNNGVATTTPIPFTLGAHAITTVYHTTNGFSANTLALTQVANFFSFMSATTSNPTTQFAQSVTFTAQVSGGQGTPTGSVTFVDINNGAVLGAAPLDGNGVAQFTTSGLPAGRYTVRAVYSGDGTYRSSFTDLLQTVVRKPILVTGTTPGKAGVLGVVEAFDPLTGSPTFLTQPFGNYPGGVKVAVGDVNNDGFNDIIAVAGPGLLNGLTRIYSGADFSLIGQFFAFPGYPGEWNVAAGDVNGDGRADIIFGTATNFDAVLVYDGGSQTLISLYSAFAPFFGPFGFHGGVTVAAGDINGDGRAEVIVGTKTQFAAAVATDGLSGAFVNLYLPLPGVTGGANVAAGDLNGDGRAEVLLTSPTSPVLFVFDGGGGLTNLALPLFGQAPGAQIATTDRDGDGKAEILAGFTLGAPFVQIIDGQTFSPIFSVVGFPSNGTNVGGSGNS